MVAHALVSALTTIWAIILLVFLSSCAFHRACLSLARRRKCILLVKIDHLLGLFWLRLIRYCDVGDITRTRRDLAILERALQLSRGVYGQLSEERSDGARDAQER